MAADDNAALLNMIARRYMTPPFHVSTALRRSGSKMRHRILPAGRLSVITKTVINVNRQLLF
jgi:hypothetical protein